MAKAYQRMEKARPAKEDNDALTRVERAVVLGSGQEDSAHQDETALNEKKETTSQTLKSLFERGSRAWLFMERVKPGLTKKLAHRWHDPFRIKPKVDEYAYELELPGGVATVHVSRMKPVNEFNNRPTTRLVPNVADGSRLDFKEERLPEDPWVPDQREGEYEVEPILEDRRPLSTSTERSVQEFKVQLVDYEKPTWGPASNLSCGGLLYDYLQNKKHEHRMQMVQVADEG
ncbi:hypothetical protein PHMEG_0004826 [Phytophthora megakarya]|uniref:Reverse transcriptase n=1 Tax=Phytophthora megakarya TaxID=4795 RepID=A0A225WSY9_9STRA|nr:hypothetical protein PHMEG_0004826 [Phytophthora megakarya]